MRGAKVSPKQRVDLLVPNDMDELLLVYIDPGRVVRTVLPHA